MKAGVKGSLYTFVFFVISEILYQLYRRRKYRSIKNQKESESRLSCTSLQVLFFPDKDIACREHFLTFNGCLKMNCRFSHKKTSLSELYRHMMACKKTMDVCVFLITCKDLGDILSILFKRGVTLRIITDGEQVNSSGSQIWTLRKEGIPVRTNHTSYLMHHKFVIIDEKVLINGSFNWTVQAITGNQENVIVTDDSAVTPLFVTEFQRLWEEFNPGEKAGGE
uniref:Mitochondrial cardiolipin hydrolase n=1 Tax=Arion vulgaris TaxID=1028688 RepID=A0A0B7BNJ5_9EUPU